MIAIVCIVGGYRDSPMPKRKHMLDGLDTGCPRLVICKRQTGMIKMIAQNDRRESLVGNRLGNVSVICRRSQNRPSDSLSEEELRIRVIGSLVPPQVNDFQVEFAFQHRRNNSVQAGGIVG